MKYPLLKKGSIVGLFLAAACLTNVNAQSINENDLKVNVNRISNPTDQLMALQPITFNYDVEKYRRLKLPQGNQYGFVSQSVATEFPTMVYQASKMYSFGKNQTKVANFQDVQMENLIPVLVAAIKEQQEQINLLKKEIGILKQRK